MDKEGQRTQQTNEHALRPKSTKSMDSTLWFLGEVKIYLLLLSKVIPHDVMK